MFYLEFMSDLNTIAIVRQEKLESDYEFKLFCVFKTANKLFSSNPDFPDTLQRL
jgi:hypothetical protein